MLISTSVQRLLTRWRAEAETLRSYAATAQADLVTTLADQLEAALLVPEEPSHKLAEAARVLGYDPDYLRKLVREGKLVNHGRKGAPRVRLSECPRKAAAQPSAPQALFTGPGTINLVARSKERARAVVANSGS